MHRVAAGIAARGQPGTRRHASDDHSKYRETATCVRDPGHSAPLDGRRNSSSAPGCGPSSRAVHGTPAGRTRESKKNFCCVTTHRRNFGVLRSLGRGLGTLTARALSFCVPRFDLGGLAPSGLPLRRLPAANLTLAFRRLAVTLVPTPRLVQAATALAQAEPWPRSSRTGPAAAAWLIITTAHGSAISQGTARGERVIVLLGRLSKPGSRRPVYTSLPEPDREGNGLRKAWPRRR